MSTPNETQPYNYPTSSASNFTRLGHPGKWKQSILVSGTTWFTGSNYGVGAVMPIGTAGGTAYLTDGGTINLAHLKDGQIYEFSISHIEGGSNVYALFRNSIVR